MRNTTSDILNWDQFQHIWANHTSNVIYSTTWKEKAFTLLLLSPCFFAHIFFRIVNDSKIMFYYFYINGVKKRIGSVCLHLCLSVEFCWFCSRVNRVRGSDTLVWYIIIIMSVETITYAAHASSGNVLQLSSILIKFTHW